MYSISTTSTTETLGVTYKDTFQDRIDNAAKAREKALERLRSKAPPNPKVVAERVERQVQRSAREAEKAEAKRAEREAKAAEQAAKAATSAPPTEEERKAERDAKYAARKARR